MSEALKSAIIAALTAEANSDESWLSDMQHQLPRVSSDDDSIIDFSDSGSIDVGNIASIVVRALKVVPVTDIEVEVAAKALRADRANRVDPFRVPDWENTSHGYKLVFLGQARAALEAAREVQA